jgi:AraC-like DNA-binding protein
MLRAFRRRYGLTPHAFLVREKVERARALLAGVATPGEVAAALGVTDQAHFTRTFAGIFGVGPGAWRGRVRRGAA